MLNKSMLFSSNTIRSHEIIVATRRTSYETPSSVD